MKLHAIFFDSAQKTRLMTQWASPEMLLNNTSSKKSDVWSFGILLYEMVTFGRLPFFGKSIVFYRINENLIICNDNNVKV